MRETGGRMLTRMVDVSLSRDDDAQMAPSQLWMRNYARE